MRSLGRRFGVFLSAMAVLVAVQASFTAEARDGVRQERRLPLNDPRSLASPDYQGYRPDWANPYAQPRELGVNDDPTPFNPADVDSGPNPLDPDAF